MTPAPAMPTPAVMPEHRLLSLADALAMYERVGALPAIELDLARTVGRVLAAPCLAVVDLPPFTQSAMDGYAIRGGETVGASAEHPVVMPVAGTVAAGEATIPPMLPGTAFRIFTGAALPVGADAVVRQEIVERAGNDMLLREPAPPGNDVRYRGEELQRGDTVAGAGQRINAGLLGALAMAGVHTVKVRPAPRVTVLVTGDEVARETGDTTVGRIHDANGPLITAWLLVRQSEVALAALSGAVPEKDRFFYEGKLAATRFFCTQVLPKLSAERLIVENTDNALMELDEAAF